MTKRAWIIILFLLFCNGLNLLAQENYVSFYPKSIFPADQFLDQKRKQQEQALVKKNTAIDKLKRFAGNIHQFNNIFPQEKVWLQFDNNAYFQGDTIWFKGYATHASTLQRAPSKVLYVELVSPGGRILQTIKRPLVDGQCHGNIILKDYSTGQARALRGILDYPSGFYEIRAYTYNMLNFDNNCIFSRVLPVYEKPVVKGYYSGASVLVDETTENPIRRVVKNRKNKKTISISILKAEMLLLVFPTRLHSRLLTLMEFLWMERCISTTVIRLLQLLLSITEWAHLS